MATVLLHRRPIIFASFSVTCADDKLYLNPALAPGSATARNDVIIDHSDDQVPPSANSVGLNKISIESAIKQ